MKTKKELGEELVRTLHAQVDALTRPHCKAAASFTKRQAADIKAGMSDGVWNALNAVAKELEGCKGVGFGAFAEICERFGK